MQVLHAYQAGLPWEGNFHSHSHPIPTRFLWGSPYGSIWGYPYGDPHRVKSYSYSQHNSMGMGIYIGVSVWIFILISPYPWNCAEWTMGRWVMGHGSDGSRKSMGHMGHGSRLRDPCGIIMEFFGIFMEFFCTGNFCSVRWVQ